MNGGGGWHDVVLECPVCRRPVEVSVDDLLTQSKPLCPTGHVLPPIDLRASGLAETLRLLDGLSEVLHRLRRTAVA